MKIELEKLIKEGWGIIRCFEEYEIYGKGNERILYDTMDKEIVVRYAHEEQTPLKQNDNRREE